MRTKDQQTRAMETKDQQTGSNGDQGSTDRQQWRPRINRQAAMETKDQNTGAMETKDQQTRSNGDQGSTDRSNGDRPRINRQAAIEQGLNKTEVLTDLQQIADLAGITDSEGLDRHSRSIGYRRSGRFSRSIGYRRITSDTRNNRF